MNKFTSPRLAALGSYNILDSPPEPDYDIITQLATQLCDVPVSTITLIDEHRSWFKSSVGITVYQLPRQHSFANCAIQTPDQLLEIPDARLDPRFDQNPLTTGQPHVIFYAGIPLVDEDGFTLGTLCVMDHKPGRLTEAQKKGLYLLGQQVVLLLTRRRENSRLQQHSHLLQAIVNNCPTGLGLWQAIREQGQIVDFEYIMVNPAKAHTAGLTVEQMSGMRLTALIREGPERINQTLQILTETLQLGHKREIEVKIQLGTDEKWGNFILVPIIDDQILVIHQDITLVKEHQARQKAYAETLEQHVTKRTTEITRLHQQLQMVTQVAGLGVWEYDETRNEMIWDDQVYAIMGITKTKPSFTLQEALEILPPEEKAQYNYAQELPADGRPIAVERRIIRPDGATRWIEGYSFRKQDADGKPIGATGILRDITQRKEAERALRQSEQRYRSVVENINEVVFQTDHERKLIYLNPYWTTLTGYTVEESLGKTAATFYSFQADETQTRQVSEDLMAQRTTSARMEVTIHRKDGSQCWAEIYAQLQFDEANQLTGTAGLVTDITDRKNRELNLQRALEKEKALNLLKSQFVTIASHEFRTPLTTIQSSVELVKLYNDMPGERARSTIQRHLGLIEKEIMHFSSLLSDMLTYGRIEAGKVVFKPKPTDLPALIDTVIQTHFSQRTDERTVTVATTGIPYPLPADPKLLDHVLINLLTNAFKFSQTNPRINVIFEADRVQLLVIDEGIGIPADEQANLFSTFFRARNAGDIQGTGLGLVIAREFVHQHGGELTMKSQENVGSTFIITLPGCA